jgi:peroxiredoxin
MDDQPFTTVELAEFSKLFLLMNPAAFTPSADTICSHIMDAFMLEHTKVRDILQVYINLVLYYYIFKKY